MTDKEKKYSLRLKKLLRNPSRDCGFVEDKYGHTHVDSNTGWEAEFGSKGWDKKGDKRLDKEIEKEINLLLDRLLKHVKFMQMERDTIRVFVQQHIWNLHQMGKKINEWNEETKTNKKLSYGSDNLIGEKLRVQILSVFYELLTSWRFSLYQELLDLDLDQIPRSEYSFRKKIIRELSKMIYFLRKDNDFNKAKRKLERVYGKKYVEEYFNINKIDKISNGFKKEGFENLFEVDSSKIKEPKGYGIVTLVKDQLKKEGKWKDFKAKLKEEKQTQEKELFKQCAKQMGEEGKRLMIFVVKNFEDKNKTRKGLCAACTYLLASFKYEVENYWIYPKKNYSAWATFYKIDRTNFKKRIKEVKENKGWFEYVLNRLNSEDPLKFPLEVKEKFLKSSSNC